MATANTGGKGSKPRPVDLEAYTSSYERIFGEKRKAKILQETPPQGVVVSLPLYNTGSIVKVPTTNLRWLEYEHDHGNGTVSARTKLQQAFRLDDGSFLWEDIPTHKQEKPSA